MSWYPERLKPESMLTADEKEKRRVDEARNEFIRRWHFLYTKSTVTNRNYYDDNRIRLQALEMGVNPVLSPAELEQLQEEIDFFFRRAYGGYIAREDIDPSEQDRYDAFVDDAMKIQALAKKAFAAAKQRTNEKYEAKFEDDDKEEAGEVVYGPGGKVVGKGRRRYSVR